MRCLLEVLNVEEDVAKFPSRTVSGQMEEVDYVKISGVDVDFYDQLIAVKLYRLDQEQKERMRAIKKADRLNIKFRNMKAPTNFEKSAVLVCSVEDVQEFVEDKKSKQSAMKLEKTAATG